MKRSSFLSIAIATLVGAGASAAEPGPELQYGARVGVAYSDNVNRTPTDEQSSGAAAVGVDVRALREAGRLQYDVFGDVEYRDYFDSDIGGQTFGRLIGSSSYGIVPETFDWLLSASFDQVREDLLLSAAPGNLEDVVMFSTGPRVTGRIGDAFEIQGEAHYTIADYSDRDADSDTVGGLVALGRRISERSFIGLGASYDDVNYDTTSLTISPDFERREYFVRFRTESSRTSVDADVGYAEISGGGLDQDGPMARVRLSRRLTPYISGFVGYTREFPTSADPTFEPLPVDGAVVGDASLITAGPRETESAQLGFTLNRPRTAATLVFSHRTEEALLENSRDRDVDDVYGSVSRLITTRSTVSLFGSYAKETTDTVFGGAIVPVDSEETLFGVRLNLVFGRALSLDVVAQHRSRDSDFAGGEFDELSGGVFLRYGSARRLGTELAAP